MSQKTCNAFSKCFEESYKCGFPILGIHSPKRMSALLNQVGNR